MNNFWDKMLYVLEVVGKSPLWIVLVAYWMGSLSELVREFEGPSSWIVSIFIIAVMSYLGWCAVTYGKVR